MDLAGPVQEWKDLAPVDDGSNQYLGDLCISLRYVPSSGKLTGDGQAPQQLDLAQLETCLTLLFPAQLLYWRPGS